LGIPVDFVGGTSQGSIIAGACGMGLGSAEMHKKCRNLFDSVFDFTLPLVSLISGKKMRKKMRSAFGDRNIEDLPITFFCIATNLTRASQVVHRSGSLLQAIRSSISLPGFMPPVCHEGDLLVDGGLLNNVPADVMRSICGKGKVIAVDVTPTVGTGEPQQFPSELSGWKLFFQKLNPFGSKTFPPFITSIMAMSAFVGAVNSKNTRREAGLADLYLELPVEEWGILDFDRIDELVEAGYQSSLTMLREAGY